MPVRTGSRHLGHRLRALSRPVPPFRSSGHLHPELLSPGPREPTRFGLCSLLSLRACDCSAASERSF